MNHHKKRILLKHLVLILKELQENKTVKTKIEDSYYQELLNTLSKDNQDIVNNLIHYLTLLYKNFREQEHGVYLSPQEDVLVSLELVQDLVKPKSVLTRREQSHLEELEQEYLGELFSRIEAQTLLKISKSQVHRFLSKLEDLGIIQKEKSYKNKGYIYSFGVEKSEIFQSLFTDNQNIEYNDFR